MFKFNPFTSKLDQVLDNEVVLDILSSEPTGEEGLMFIDSSTYEMKIYYGGSWIVLHTFGAPAYDYLLLETGDYFLLETGDKIILE